MFAFQLWREFKLSIAEILAVFPEWNTVFCDISILVLSWIKKEDILKKADFLGWTIKVIEILSFWDDINNILKENLIPKNYTWKFNYSINIFWNNWLKIKELLKTSKEIVKNTWLNPRFVNKDFKNISSTIIIKEWLVKKETDTNILFFNNLYSFWRTIFVQNIYSYSNRDFSKTRDMNIWMLPPKLAQMMINIWKKDKEIISLYDPFVWLWTVLIEWILMWIKEIYWSDINKNMIETSSKNLEDIKWKYNFNYNIFNQNAKYISEFKDLNKIDLIITEWYLWEVMTKNNISIDRINKQKEKLQDLYNWFFEWLRLWWFKWNIVISFPFWDVKWKFLFFNEIYDIIEKYCVINEILEENKTNFKPTNKWSLLYKRDSQLVWREIFSLLIK